MERSGRVRYIALLMVISAASIVMASAFLGGNLINIGQQNVATAATLPFTTELHVMPTVLAGDATMGAPYFIVEPHWMDNFGERHCEECTMIEYSPGVAGTAGAAYVTDKAYDFSDAKRVVFFVMGENGGEKVRLGFAGKDLPAGAMIPADRTNQISEKIQFAATREIKLTKDWQRIEISLKGADLGTITYPFAFQIDSDAPKIRFYVGGVFFDTEEIRKPLKFKEPDAA